MINAMNLFLHLSPCSENNKKLICNCCCFCCRCCWNWILIQPDSVDLMSLGWAKFLIVDSMYPCEERKPSYTLLHIKFIVISIVYNTDNRGVMVPFLCMHCTPIQWFTLLFQWIDTVSSGIEIRAHHNIITSSILCACWCDRVQSY